MAFYKDRLFLKAYSLAVTILLISFIIINHPYIRPHLPLLNQTDIFHSQSEQQLHQNIFQPNPTFPIQVINFSATSYLHRRAGFFRPNISTHNFFYYDNIMNDCSPYVGDRIGVFNANPPPGYRSNSHGILHERGNLLTFLREAKELGRVAILRNIALSHAHNKNGWVCSPWSRYWNIKKLNQVVPVFEGYSEFRNRLREKTTWEHFGEEDDIETLKKSKAKVVVRVLHTHTAYRIRHNGNGLNSDIGKQVEDAMEESEYVYRIAKKVAHFVTENGKRNLTIIKVRRGDKLKENNKCLNECTLPERIIDVLEQNNVSKTDNSVYILSNEKQKDFFDDIKKKGYRLVTAKDVPYFKEDDIAKDNYMLFTIELALAKFASGMIGTFVRGIRHWGELHPERLLFRDKLKAFDEICLNDEKAKHLKTCQTECTKCFVRDAKAKRVERGAAADGM